MNESPAKLPRPVLFAFLVLLILAILVTVLRKGSPPKRQTEGTSDNPPSVVVPTETSAQGTMRETRREGTAYDSTLVGRIHGIMKQSTQLAAYHPIFRGDIRSSWVAPWTIHVSAEVVHNDGRTIRERRTFHALRSIELIAEPERCDLTYTLDPSLSHPIAELAAKLRSLRPVHLDSDSMGALIKSKDFDYAEIARLTGINPSDLVSERSAVSATSRILDEFEGRAVEVLLENGRADWVVDDDLPKQIVDALERVDNLVDYTALPPPELEVDEEQTLTDVPLNEWLPPLLADDFLGNYDSRLTLVLVRRADHLDDEAGDRFRTFTGEGLLHLIRPDGMTQEVLTVEKAALWVDVTDPFNRFLHRFEISLPVPSRVLKAHRRFREIEWEGDLMMDVVYTVDREM
jgi:hypothetical protein